MESKYKIIKIIFNGLVVMFVIVWIYFLMNFFNENKKNQQSNSNQQKLIINALEKSNQTIFDSQAKIDSIQAKINSIDFNLEEAKKLISTIKKNYSDSIKNIPNLTDQELKKNALIE